MNLLRNLEMFNFDWLILNARIWNLFFVIGRKTWLNHFLFDVNGWNWMCNRLFCIFSSIGISSAFGPIVFSLSLTDVVLAVFINLLGMINLCLKIRKKLKSWVVLYNICCYISSSFVMIMCRSPFYFYSLLGNYSHL